MRNLVKKNNDNFDGKWPFLFNAIIDSLDLREIEMLGRKYTWANSLGVPTYERLDQVLVSTEWEQKIPMAIVVASDHTPLLLNTGDKGQSTSQPLFRFELGWLLRKIFSI